MSNAGAGTTGERRVAVIIEDDADIRHLLEEVFAQAGFDAISANNGLDGVEAVRNYNPLITTLDVGMPGIDGFETAKRIRAFSSAYIVMLTAKGEEIDALQGLDAGADDYVLKPFRPRELRARIEAMLRRPRAMVTEGAPSSQGSQAAQAQPAQAPTAQSGVAAATAADAVAPETDTFVAGGGDVTLETVAMPAIRATGADLSLAAEAPAAVGAPFDETEGWFEHNGLRVHPEMRLVEVDGRPVDLTLSEFELAAALLESGRRVRSKADLALMLRGSGYVTSYYIDDADKRAVEVHIGNLRKKLGENAAEPRWIETVRGVGYRLAAAD